MVMLKPTVPTVLTSPNPLSTLQKQFACARLSQPLPAGITVPAFPQRSPPWLFDQSGLRWLGISDLIAEPEGPTFISYKVARSRLDRLTLRDTRPICDISKPVGNLPPRPMPSFHNDGLAR